MTSSVPADHIHIKPHEVGAPSDVHQKDWQEIMEILHGLDDVGMVDAANDFHHLAHALRRIAYNIAQYGKELAKNWEGSGADAALTHFEDLYNYTSSLSTQAKQTGNALGWLGNDVLPHYKNLESPKLDSAKTTPASKKGSGNSGGAPLASASGSGQAAASGFSPAGQTAANEAAREYLRSLSGHIETANKAMPATITGVPAKKTTRKKTTTTTQPSPTSPPPGGGNPPSTTTGPVQSGPVTISPVQGPVTTSPTTPPTGTLQSVGGPGVTTTAPPANGGMTGSGAIGGTGAGAAGGGGMTVPAGWVPSAGSTAADTPASGASGASGADDAASAADGAAGADAAGREAAEGAGSEMGMMPMMPGGSSGSQDKERWRRSEADEDDDLWGVPADGTEAVIE